MSEAEAPNEKPAGMIVHKLDTVVGDYRVIVHREMWPSDAPTEAELAKKEARAAIAKLPDEVQETMAPFAGMIASSFGGRPSNEPKMKAMLNIEVFHRMSDTKVLALEVAEDILLQVAHVTKHLKMLGDAACGPFGPAILSSY